MESIAIIVSAGSVHRLLRSKGLLHLYSVKTHGFESFSPWLIRGSIEVCISQEKPVILQGACPGRLLMNTYGNRNESDITLLKSRCTCKAHNIIAAVGE